jgi:arsenate reductase
MAEGWAKALKRESFDVYSAGIETHGLNPNAVKVMAEVGVDISSQTSDNIEEYANREIDHVVTVCHHAHENCPVFPAKAEIHHTGFEDPPKQAKDLADRGASEEEQLDCYRKVRDDIRSYVEGLPENWSL